MENKSPLFEACVENFNDALKAEKSGADRIELCGDLSSDGITPDRELIKKVLETISIPIKVMIRPRGGNFVYSIKEFEQMISSIRFCRDLGITEIVTGLLTKNNTLDTHLLEILGSFAHPMKITIHKCIDETESPIEEIKRLRSIPQVHAILTSGKKNTAKEGAQLIKKMQDYFHEKYFIIPAGKITKKNFHEIHTLINAKEYHGRALV